MTHPKPPIEQYARSTVDTKPEYAKHRILNCETKDRLEAILDKEVEFGPRQQRIAWINQAKAQIE